MRRIVIGAIATIAACAAASPAARAGTAYEWDGGARTPDWNNPTNYEGNSGFPDGPGDAFYARHAATNACLLNGNRTIGRFYKNYTAGHNTAITPGSPAGVLTWDTGSSEDALFFVRGSGGYTNKADLRCYTTVDMVLNSSLVWDGTTQRRFSDNANGEIKGTLSGAGRLTVKWNAAKGDFEGGFPMQFEFRGSSPNTHTGGTVLACNGVATGLANPTGRAGFRLNKPWATGLGDTWVETNAEIYIPANTWSGGAIHDGTSLHLEGSGSARATATLDAGVDESVQRLFLDGVKQRAGTWGSTASGARFQDDTWLAGAGVLRVAAGPLVVESPVASQIGTTNATLGATALDGQDAAVSARGTAYGTASNPVANRAEASLGTETGVFSHVRSGLLPGTHYYFRGWATNAADGLAWSGNGQFYTEPEAATDLLFTAVTNTAVTISWTPNAGAGGTLVVMREGEGAVDAEPVDGTVYDDGAAAFMAGDALGASNYVVYAGAGTSVTITGLAPCTAYRVALYAFAGPGAMVNYQTDGAPTATTTTVLVAAAPLLTSPTAAAIGTTEAVLGATVVDDGGSGITSWGTAWDIAAPGTGHKAAEAGSTNGVFAHRHGGLPSATRIYARGWASNAVGIGFTPTDVVFYTEPLAPSNVAFTGVTAGGMTIGWAPGNGTGRVVVMKQGGAVTHAPADGVTNYTAAAAFGAPGASDLGGGEYVVYAGAGTNVTVSGLQRVTTYGVAVFEYAGDGALRNYRQGAAAASRQTAWEGRDFTYDGADSIDMDWNDRLNYVGDSGFPDGPGDRLLVVNTTQANAYRLNGNRTLSAFVKSNAGTQNTVITGGTDPASVLTWDTGVPGSNAVFFVRGVGGPPPTPELRCRTEVDMVLNSSLVWDGATSRAFADGVNGEIKGTLSGPGQLTVKWNASRGDIALGSPMQFEFRGSSSNVHAGGTVLAWNGVTTDQVNPTHRAGFRLNKPWATGLGDTRVCTNAEIYLPANAWAGGAIHDGTSLYLEANATTNATVDIATGTVEAVRSLYFFDPQTRRWRAQASGTWGSSHSPAAHRSDKWFSGAGVLNVLSDPYGTSLRVR